MGRRSYWPGGLLVLFVLSLLVGCAPSVEPVITVELERRIDALEVRLNRLTQVYGDIYWKAVVGSVDGFDVQMNALMRKRAAIGDECRNLLNLHYDEHLDETDIPLGKRRFHCGWTSAQRISPLKVCDGVKDCKNGYDERFKICHNPLTTGSQWIGHVFYNHCGMLNGINQLVVYIVSVERNPWFGPQIKLKTVFGYRKKTMYGTSVEHFEATGVFYFATRTFTVASLDMDNSQLEFTGRFYGGLINAWFIGNINRVGTGEICAEFRFVREGRFWMEDSFSIPTDSIGLDSVMAL